MATPNTKRVAVELDRPREVLLDLNAFCTAEELTGRNFMQQTSWQNLSWRDLRALLFAGLQSAEEAQGRPFPLSLHDVGRLLQMSDMSQIVAALLDAFGAAMPEPEAKPEPDPEEAKEGAVPLHVSMPVAPA